MTSYSRHMLRFFENLFIRQILYRYRDIKQKHPEFDEDLICRKVIEIEVLDKDTKNFFLKEVLKNKTNLNVILRLLMEERYPRYSIAKNGKINDLSRWKIRILNLENRIEDLKSRILSKTACDLFGEK